MRRIVNFTQSNLLPLISALKENTEEGEYTIGMEGNAPVGGEYYHVMDDEQVDISENTVISENSTDRRVNSIIKKYSGVSDFNEIRAIRSKILKLIPNARAKNEMYLGAVAMWYLTGCLNDASDRFKLNYLLGRLHHGASFGFEKILGREDFNMVSFDTMKWIMDDIMPSEETAESYNSKGKIQKVGNYTIYRMDSYDDARYVSSQLSQVHWCIFEDEDTFSYMSEGYTVYVCVRDGYENARMMSYDELVEKLLSHGMTSAVESLEENYPKDDMYDDFVNDIAGDDDETAELLFVNNEYELGLPPCDDYGLSMFVVIVSNEAYKNGRIVMVYSRYNLPNMFDGGILSESELSNVIGADAMSVFTPNGNVQEQKTISENLEFEVDSSEVDLSSFKKQDSLPSIWKDEDTLDSKVRLKLLDIADDFWEYVDVTWVEPKGIIITGSLCNYNWSEFSDVDLHLIVDFNEIDERTDFVREYLDSKKNEWNEEHGNLKIYGYPVELYVQNIDEDVDAGGVYDLEENKWLRKPSYDDMEEIGAESDDIKEKAARVMTIIDDMWDYFNGTDDSHKLEVLGDDADNLWRKIKKMRTDGLTEDGEMSVGNIVYKYMRRKKYLDKLFDLRAAIYDKVNTITEGVSYDKFREGKTFRCSKLLTEWDRTDYFEKAKEYFGTTNDLNECGFILPNGEMLDLSSSKGRRGRPHRNVEAIGIGLESFIEHGAIRCDSRYKLINICKRPTKEQIIRLVEIIKANNGSVSLDLGNGHVTFDYVDYKNANYKRIINDIINFFDNKIKPSSLYESKNIIKEYLEKDYNLPLYKYFKWASTASSCEKARDLAYSCSYYINKYIKKIYYRYSEFENLLNNGEFDYGDESLVEMFLNMLEENNLCDHFVSEMQSIVDYYELPSWCTMDFERIVKNEWCIHFGSDSDSIAKEGFTGGTPDIEHLAYTNAGAQKTSAGYDFAFLMNDRNVDYNEYGDEAVIFRTSGVEIYHYGDNQNQVVFWGPNVKNFIPIHQDNGDWVVYGAKGQILVRCGRPSEIAIWATENLPQYRKQIMSGKSGYIPTMSYWDENERKVVRKPYPLYRNESIRKYLALLKENSLNEEVVADGSANGNPYAERWKAEREALKNFISNFGTLMQSKEDNKEGRVYKVYYDKLISDLIGYNYCLCVQYDEVKNKPKSTVYVRAYDKFTPFIRRNLQFDDRGVDNERGTADDIGNSYQPVQIKR